MRVSVPENFQNSAVGRFLFLEKLFSAVDFSRSVSMSGFERLDRLFASTAREAVRRKASGMGSTGTAHVLGKWSNS
jgi:hypothetical protein